MVRTAWMWGVLLLVAAAKAHAVESAPLGVWAYETTIGPTLQGELVVTRGTDRYRATVGGREATVKVSGEAIQLELPDNAGRYRGALRRDGKAIDGFWLQPATTEDQRYPGGSSQAFASPLVLQRSQRNEWRGAVRPLPDRFRLFLKLFRDEQGQLLAVFRDPEQNRIGGGTRWRVAIEGRQLHFQRAGSDGVLQSAFDGTLLNDGERIRLTWPDLGRDIELLRSTPLQARAFFPRGTDTPPYRYQVPAQINDGWRVARARSVGLDEGALAAAVQGIGDGDPAAARPSLVHSWLVARHGKLVLEEYFFGYDRNALHDMRSAGKTFASILLGAVMHQGVALSPESKVYDVMAVRGPFAHPDARKSSITLAHLLTHSAGLDCDDNSDTSLGNEGVMQRQAAQADWWKYTLDLPQAFDPGTRYAYCSANINLVGGALTAASGIWLPELFERSLARPLGIRDYYWNLIPNGEGYLGGGAWLRPRDLLKFGQLYLDGGVWRGERIVDAAWVSASTAARMEVTPATTGYSEEEFGQYYGRGVDAYAWHLGELKLGERRYRTYAATGNGGQLLVVVPQLDLVAVFTGGNYLQGGIWNQWPQRILGSALQSLKD